MLAHYKFHVEGAPGGFGAARPASRGPASSRLPFRPSHLLSPDPARASNANVVSSSCSQFHPDDNSVLAVVTYAVHALGVEHVVIAGHTHCGGAAACQGASLLFCCFL
jgi:hypothetical protein